MRLEVRSCSRNYALSLFSGWVPEYSPGGGGLICKGGCMNMDRVVFTNHFHMIGGVRKRGQKRRIRRRANALWGKGGLARACAAALPSLDPLRSDDALLKLRDLFPARPCGDHMPGPDPAHRLVHDVRARILAAIPKVIRTLPRRSGPGPTSSRFEHNDIG